MKNEGVLPLPLDRPFRLFVTGPNAGNHSPLGDWTLEQPEENVVSVVEGLRRIAPPSCRIDYYDCGASIRSLNGEHVAEAARRAAGADAALIVVGENSLRYQNQEKTCGENIDTSDIGLPGMQLALVQAVRAAGAPAIVALINGRPLAVEWIAENAAALIEAWEPGCFGGLALAEILFGAVNPSGKMPISVPRGAGHIQTIYNHKPSQYFRNYVFGKTGPLFEFGDGLSYAKFEYSDLRLPERVAPGQDVSVRFTIRNAGERAGEEVALVFVRDLVGSVATPVRALKAFRRVALQPGESAAVALAIPFDSLALYDRRMRRVVEPGKFQVFVGGLTGEFEAL
ncbi:MAG: Periplasmic beta-glucosidase precursor [candidate division BRC1 bacterium ADurb.BinA364]|nr:MAG: Periplasmic beta-glucosidase precursor [candidate division BRC1 bacterium ADurb.BinA364]